MLTAAAIDEVNGQTTRILKKLCKTPVTLEWRDVNYSIKTARPLLPSRKKTSGNESSRTKNLLRRISGIARPGELVAIMGGSGAGKTTLLNTLAGRIKLNRGDKVSGTILVNGQERDSSWRRTAGYVEQFDLMYGRLTVQETIQFAADCKLPRSATFGEKRAIVDAVISLLGLNSVRHSLVGDDLQRGVSGGERKRTAIGIELVTFPGLLFLDEPTTGLDSSTAQNLIETLKEIAKKTSMTIVLTIHQPRASILFLFSHIIFVSQGQSIFNGSISACLAHIKMVLGVKCPEHENPADFVMDLLTVKNGDEEASLRVKKLIDAWDEIENGESTLAMNGIRSEEEATETEIAVEEEEEAEYYSNNENAALNENNNVTVIAVTNPNTTRSCKKCQMIWPNSRWGELGILLKRNFTLLWRAKLELLASFGETLTVCLLLSFVFFQLDNDFSGVQSRLGLLFATSLTIVMSTINPLLSVFAVDRAILLRERAGATYRVLPSYTAKFISLIPSALFLLAIFATPIYFITGLTMPFSRYLVFMAVLTSLRLASIALGLFIASIFESVKVSLIIGAMIIATFVIFGGYLANPNDITWILRWIQYISLQYYSFQALVQNELNDNNFGVQGSADVVPGSYYLNLYTLDQINEWGCLGAILGLGLGFVILGYFSLRIATRPRLTLKIKNK